MKKFLKSLENELKKLKFNEDDIKEILADHEEMIQAAINDGVTEEELNNKFGDPEKVARELKSDNLDTERAFSNDKDYTNVEELKGYDLFKTFSVVDEGFTINVNLVSEDIKFYAYEGSEIEVFAKGDTEKYHADYVKQVFSLTVEKGIKLFGFRNKSTKFVVRIPKGYDVFEFNYNNTSGDADVHGLTVGELKFNAVSGDFELFDFIMKNAVINTVSGDCEAKNIQADSLHLRTVSGDFEIAVLEVFGELKLKSVSGDFELKNAVAGPTRLDSVSGDLEGYEFYPAEISMKTISGDVCIENTDSTKSIKVTSKKSMSGDIKIKGTIVE